MKNKMTPLEKWHAGLLTPQLATLQELKAHGADLASTLAVCGKLPRERMTFKILSLRPHEGDTTVAMQLAANGHFPDDLLNDKAVLDLEDYEDGKPTGWRVRDTLAYKIGYSAELPPDCFSRVIRAINRCSIKFEQLTDEYLSAANRDGWTVAHYIASKSYVRDGDFKKRLADPPIGDWTTPDGITVRDLLTFKIRVYKDIEY